MLDRLVCAIRGHRQWRPIHIDPTQHFALFTFWWNRGLRCDIVTLNRCDRCSGVYVILAEDVPIPVNMKEHQEAQAQHPDE